MVARRSSGVTRTAFSAALLISRSHPASFSRWIRRASRVASSRSSRRDSDSPSLWGRAAPSKKATGFRPQRFSCETAPATRRTALTGARLPLTIMSMAMSFLPMAPWRSTDMSTPITWPLRSCVGGVRADQPMRGKAAHGRRKHARGEQQQLRERAEPLPSTSGLCGVCGAHGGRTHMLRIDNRRDLVEQRPIADDAHGRSADGTARTGTSLINRKEWPNKDMKEWQPSVPRYCRAGGGGRDPLDKTFQGDVAPFSRRHRRDRELQCAAGGGPAAEVSDTPRHAPPPISHGRHAPGGPRAQWCWRAARAGDDICSCRGCRWTWRACRCVRTREHTMADNSASLRRPVRKRSSHSC